MERFRLVGFLSVKKQARRAELARLKSERETWVVFESPYRLSPLLADLHSILEPSRRVAVACDLTMGSENVMRGTIAQVKRKFDAKPFKGEFVIVVAGKGNR
jgi:16S rRNA (cytidine1402-2'-O)-methyltransferase